MEKILITGCSGFIGMHLCISMLEDNYNVLGIDNMNNYYDPILKKTRLKKLEGYKNFNFIKSDISDVNLIKSVFYDFRPNKVINLAAQAGVRYSLVNPQAYIDANVMGFMNILECCRHYGIQGLIYASSSSVYGGNEKTPFSEKDRINNPISIYATTKITNELMAKTYSHLYGLNTTGLRYFTVYGPWGRPDMAMYIFVEKILKGEPIKVFNHGLMQRDFTYIEDIISGTRSSIDNNYHCEVFNLGNNCCEDLMDMIGLIEKNLGQKAIIHFEDVKLGDVVKTFANIDYSKKMLNYSPQTPISLGIPKFIEWYKNYNSYYQSI